jgi:small subunit ribosomal protein S6
MDKVLHQYEAMFLLPAGDAEAAVNLCRGVIEAHGGQVLVIKKWDERKLAYEIARQKRGLYIISFFNAPSNAAVGIERDVTLSEAILRVLVTRADHLNPEEMAAVEPQPIIPREERPIWDRPYGDRDNRDNRGDRGGDRGGDRPRGRRDESPIEAAKE